MMSEAILKAVEITDEQIKLLRWLLQAQIVSGIAFSEQTCRMMVEDYRRQIKGSTSNE